MLVKVADMKLFWTRSVGMKIPKQVIEYTLDGNTKTLEIGPEVESFTLEMRANKSGRYKVTTYSEDGQPTVSDEVTFQTGDLETVPPATGLGSAITAIREIEVDEEPPAETVSRKRR